MNRIPARVEGQNLVIADSVATLHPLSPLQGGDGLALVRPESVNVETLRESKAVSNAVVVSRAFLGPMSKVVLSLQDGSEISSVMTSSKSNDFSSGDAVRVSVAPGSYLMVGA
jgi:putative spermidine/putrescine transport system ATP-binding protein